MKVLADWRDSARDFPASLYAYATPTPAAIAIIAAACSVSPHPKPTSAAEDALLSSEAKAALAAVEARQRQEKRRSRGLLEVGAGMGYWAALLQEAGCAVLPCPYRSRRPICNFLFAALLPVACFRSVDVAAVDDHPPGFMGGFNDYHGETPAFTSVCSADAADAAAQCWRQNNPRALFLCYPPPVC